MEERSNRLTGLSPDEVLRRGREIMMAVRREISKVIFGEELDPLIEVLLVAPFLAGGHVLTLASVGLGKTTTLDGFARAIGGQFNRIQCRPDMLPSDFSGCEVYDQKKREFVVRHGPLMGAHIVLVDEINRATPKALAALLEAMAEGRVTIGGQEFPLSDLFLVVATRNPLESEGVYLLPEAVLDRFFAQPTIEEITAPTMGKILQDHDIHKHVGERLSRVQAVTNPREILTIREAIFDPEGVYMDERIVQYIVALWEAVGSHPAVAFAKSPRGAIHMRNAAKVAAFLAGRGFVVPEDVRRFAVGILGHRIFMKPEVRYDRDRGFSSVDIVGEALDRVKFD